MVLFPNPESARKQYTLQFVTFSLHSEVSPVGTHRDLSKDAFASDKQGEVWGMAS